MASSRTRSQSTTLRIGLLCVSIASLVVHIVAFSSASWLSIEIQIPVSVSQDMTAPISVTVAYRWGPWAVCAAENIPANLTNDGKGMTLDMCFSISITDAMSSELRKEGSDAQPQSSLGSLFGDVWFIRWTQALGVLSVLAFVPVPVLLILSIVRRHQRSRCCPLDSICIGLSVVTCLLLVVEVLVFWLHMMSISSAFDALLNVKAGKWAYTWGIYFEAVCANVFAIVSILEFKLMLASQFRPDDVASKEDNRREGLYTGYRYTQLRNEEDMPYSDI